VVRAFLAAALRGQTARTPDGWRSVIQDLRFVADGDFDPVRAAVARPVEAALPLHDDTLEAHRSAGLHQAPALGDEERLRQLHNIARECWPQRLQNVLSFLERTA
jgi:hypothetical protein